ncbi:MAG TPA: helix-turn-helix domain-containing protein [Acidothermaceae bacterium]|nr:helix-turn-helix domain-containing protein [Acidothermaceae bacterium]
MPRLTVDNLQARRRAILDGARRCFARDGYEGATVRRLEQEIGLSRGAIFHHFRDKESLFFAVAEDDAAEMSEVVAKHGLVELMRDLKNRDAGWLGVQLELSRRLRTDPDFRERWALRSKTISDAARDRLRRGVERGTLRTDVPVETIAAFLELVLDGLVLHRAMGVSDDDLDAVLDLVESTVRRDGF